MGKVFPILNLGGMDTFLSWNRLASQDAVFAPNGLRMFNWCLRITIRLKAREES